MFRFFSYRLALKNPLCLPGNKPLRHREGLLLHRPDTGGWGEAAPLPGYSSETLAEVVEAVTASQLDSTHFPSLRFAIECTEKTFSAPEQHVNVNALWIVGKEKLGDLLLRLKDWDAPVIKVKPGDPPRMDEVMELLAQRPDCRLRIDGNRQWSVEQTLRLFDRLPEGRLEYIEEPLAEDEGYADLWARANVPIGLDESLLLPSGKKWVDFQGVKALILKPTLMGDAEDRAFWIRKAAEANLRVVWSSCFESGVGLWNLARLARGGDIAGLDTGGVFEQDVLAPRPLVCRGQIPPPAEGGLSVFENGLGYIQD
ncbi:enolase C-terminal domain-like protein [Kiritimatiellaeota bacterium B1221]|nr:enolase C-terminal domain-like protein [Kiritimatiellaeota bacterium B1221]